LLDAISLRQSLGFFSGWAVDYKLLTLPEHDAFSERVSAVPLGDHPTQKVSDCGSNRVLSLPAIR